MAAGGVAFQARQILRRARSGTLATLADGAPYASLVTIASDPAGDVLLLLSDLADHTRNLKADDRASLLLEEARGRVNPQTGPRIGLQGRVAPIVGGAASTRFLAHHPSARGYAGFADFGFYRLGVERVHYVGGFARAHWIEAAGWHVDGSALAAAETELLERLNNAHSELIQRLVRDRLGRRGDRWKAVGCDPDGIDLRQGNRFAWLAFAAPLMPTEDPIAALQQL